MPTCCSQCLEKYNKKMTVQQELRLSPWQKWQQFRRFPTKFVINVALAVLSSFLILDYVSSVNNYVRASFDSWDFLLGPTVSRPSFSMNGQQKIYHLYNAADVLASLNQTVDRV